MEKQLINMKATPLVEKWANKRIGTEIKEMRTKRHGIVESWRLGDRENGIWFFFIDEEKEENSAYRQIPKQIRGK